MAEHLPEQRFLTLFIPLGAQEPNPLAAVRQKGTDGAEVTFEVEFVDLPTGM